jgi:hypothetical protein
MWQTKVRWQGIHSEVWRQNLGNSCFTGEEREGNKPWGWKVLLVEWRPCPLLGYGIESVARVSLFRELVSTGLGSFLLKYDIMQLDWWVPTFRRNVDTYWSSCTVSYFRRKRFLKHHCENLRTLLIWIYVCEIPCTSDVFFSMYLSNSIPLFFLSLFPPQFFLFSFLSFFVLSSYRSFFHLFIYLFIFAFSLCLRFFVFSLFANFFTPNRPSLFFKIPFLSL